MYRRELSPPAHFSVHAEFTISHPGADDPRNRPRTSTERDETTGGVRMTYSWQPEWTARAQSEDRASEGGGAKRQQAWPSSASNSNKSIYSDTPSSATLTPPRSVPPPIVPPSAAFGTPYTRGYQKGNLFFTSTPPCGADSRESTTSNKDIPKDPRLNLVHDSSGYGSDLLSPNSHGGSLPRRAPIPYDRKCRSTCNITLSTNLTGSQDPLNVQSQCGRTQSLRCQTSSPSVLGNTLNPPRYYGCGDPWCHHLRQGDEFIPYSRFSPVPEESLPANNLPSRSNTYTVADNATNKKDASVQTFEMVDKCTSPFLRMNSTDSVDSRSVRKYQRRGLTEPIRKNYSPAGSFTPDSLDSLKPSRRLTRSPKLRRLPAFDHTKEPIKEQSPEDSKPGDPLKKPRTVHIDVYCTGTEMESNASSDSSDEGSGSRSKSASTPQTVFENEKMRVTHKKAGDRDVPFYLKNQSSNNKQTQPTQPIVKSFETNTSVEREDSDEDNASTAYPSKMSSYSTIGDMSASISSVPRSWTTYSMSSCPLPEDYDSVANTSWKDTFSDIDSFLHSRSSIAPTESLDFVPRKLYETNQSIDETPEFFQDRKDILETPSVGSVQPSDSFEYANSEDRFRIRQMEDMWRKKGGYTIGHSKSSPKSEKTLQMQQKKMQEYMERKIKDKSKWNSKDSDSNESDDSGKGWTFVKGRQSRGSSVRGASRADTDSASKSELKKDPAPISREQGTTNSVANQRSPVQSLPNTVQSAFSKATSSQNQLGGNIEALSSQSRVPTSKTTPVETLSSQSRGHTSKISPGETLLSQFRGSTSKTSPVDTLLSQSRGPTSKTSQVETVSTQSRGPTSKTTVVEIDTKMPSNPEASTKSRTPRTRPTPLKKPEKKETIHEQGSLSDSSPTSRSPSAMALKQRLSLDPTIRSPFMLVPGVYTEPRSIARKFGTVVSVMKKPGHHIGPAKNPDCLCEHCQSYWEAVGPRCRTRSMGDPPSGNWKQFLEESNKREANDGEEKKQEKLPFSDF